MKNNNEYNTLCFDSYCNSLKLIFIYLSKVNSNNNTDCSVNICMDNINLYNNTIVGVHIQQDS